MRVSPVAWTAKLLLEIERGLRVGQIMCSRSRHGSRRARASGWGLLTGTARPGHARLHAEPLSHDHRVVAALSLRLEVSESRLRLSASESLAGSVTEPEAQSRPGGSDPGRWSRALTRPGWLTLSPSRPPAGPNWEARAKLRL